MTHNPTMVKKRMCPRGHGRLFLEHHSSRESGNEYFCLTCGYREHELEPLLESLKRASPFTVPSDVFWIAGYRHTNSSGSTA